MNIKGLLKDADYLFDAQKERLLEDLVGDILFAKEQIMDFLDTVLGISEHELSAQDATKIDNWLAQQEI